MAFYAHCEVLNAGVQGDKVGILMKQLDEQWGKGKEQWFYPRDGVRREMLAVALAAMTSNLTVNIDAPDPKTKSDIDDIALSWYPVQGNLFIF